jgi:hypothetical protein
MSLQDLNLKATPVSLRESAGQIEKEECKLDCQLEREKAHTLHSCVSLLLVALCLVQILWCSSIHLDSMWDGNFIQAMTASSPDSHVVIIKR